MHCVNRIKCCGWIDDVTFLYYPGSLFPLMWMMPNVSGCRLSKKIHKPGNEVHHMWICSLFTTVKQS